MLSKLDAALIAACMVSGAMALETNGRVDISPDSRKVALAPIACRPVLPSGLSLPGDFEIVVPVQPDTGLPEFAIECQPS